jgi:LacI family transcriptional regulator
MATIKDVARSAEVSVGTVSKVVSKDPTVKARLKERVERAITELGYKPNLRARALRTNQVTIIGLIVPDISNPFFAHLGKCVEAEAAAHGHTVMLANSDDDPAQEARQVEALANQLPKGLIVVGSGNASQKTNSYALPIISVDRRFGDHQLIATDHEGASALVADHLYQLGHKRIAYISGPNSTEVGRLRRAGFCNRLEQIMDQDKEVELTVVEGLFDYGSGEKLARALLSPLGDELNDTRPTAIAAASDQQAIGALRTARDLGISVPQALSIAGFDDIELARLVVPRLTSVSQRVEQLAKAAVQAILNAGDAPQADISVEADLVPRNSTAQLQRPCAKTE